jgi:hypothetical protein
MKMNPLTSYGRVRGGRSREGGFLEHGFGDGAVDQLDPGQALGQWGTGQISVNCQLRGLRGLGENSPALAVL